MLMINGVKLQMIDQIPKIRDFNQQYPVRGQHPIHTVEEIMEIVNVRKDMPPQDQVRSLPLARQEPRGGG